MLTPGGAGAGADPRATAWPKERRLVAASETGEERPAKGARSRDVWGDALEVPTRPASQTGLAEGLLVPTLTILWHGDPRRVGERAWLPALDDGRTVGLSRLEPLFAPTGADSSFGRGEAGGPAPLSEARVSRRPIRLIPRPGGIAIEQDPGLPPLEVDGRLVEGCRRVSDEELALGVVLLLGGRVALLLQRRPPEEVHRLPGCGLVGESAAVAGLRRQIGRYADLDHAVLLRGASGTGKELVARALQAASRRRGGPFLTLNMAAVPASLAASELFGAARGAFSGADRAREGYFARADRGTLFLDEIGEAPREVQGALLRVLESGEIQPVGGDRPRTVDVRVIAATDADLEARVDDGRFAAPLFQRLRGLEIHLPALRERREDVGRLVLHFLLLELRALGEEHRLAPPSPLLRPWVPARLVAQLALHDWPGNVRELRNELRQLVVASRGADRLATGAWLAPERRSGAVGGEMVAAAAPPPIPPAPPPRRSYRDPSDVGEEELVARLAEHDWNLAAAAEALGLSRPSLYTLIDDCPRLRKATEIAAEEIAATLDRCGGDLTAAARGLRVSKQGLKRQIRRLRIS
jgi:two-component system, NtrC family, nitrogen regulation response regulator GlnG